MKFFCITAMAAGSVLLAACEQGARDDASPQATADGAATTSQDATVFQDPPPWAKEAIWYQIFVERFHNGDPENDPQPGDIDGTYPGVIPDAWKVTPWTQDWYKPDDYFADLEGANDYDGNPIVNFDQKLGLRRYGGDLQGVIDKAEYLEALGVTAVYFNPLNDAPSLHKFDARNWRHIDRNFGPSPDRDVALMAQEAADDPSSWVMTGADELFIELISELHKRDIKVILDYSWNHTGQRFWAWLDLVEKQEKSKFADWYWVQSFDDPETPENEFSYRGWFGVSSLPEIKESVYVDHAERIEPFEGDIASEAAKNHILAVTRRWLDPNGDGDPSDGVDGFRLDVAAEVPFGFWRDYRRFVRDINPNAYLIGEVWWEKWPDKLLDPAPFLKGDIFDAVMNYRWYREARRFFGKAPEPITASDYVSRLQSLSGNLRAQNNYAMMNMTASHDTPRLSTSLFNKKMYKVDAKASSNPDYKIQKPDAQTYEVLRLLLAHQFTYVGAPQIWAGDEMGMWGADDPHTRKPLIWPEFEFEPEAAHPLGQPRIADEVRFDDDLFAYYQKLIVIRKENPVLSRGDLDFILTDDDNDVLAYRRHDGANEVIAVFNAGAKARTITVPATGAGDYRDILGGAALDKGDGGITLRLEARSAAILAGNG